MSAARVCDACGRVEKTKPYEGWYSVQENDGEHPRYVWGEEIPERPPIFHVCSWGCLATLGTQKSLLSEITEPTA